MNNLLTINDLKIGDIVTGYPAGYWQIVELLPNAGSPVGCIKLLKLLNKDGSLARGKKNVITNVINCKKVDKSFIDIQLLKEQNEALNKYNAINLILQNKENT